MPQPLPGDTPVHSKRVDWVSAWCLAKSTKQIRLKKLVRIFQVGRHSHLGVKPPEGGLLRFDSSILATEMATFGGFSFGLEPCCPKAPKGMRYSIKKKKNYYIRPITLHSGDFRCNPQSCGVHVKDSVGIRPRRRGLRWLSL